MEFWESLHLLLYGWVQVPSQGMAINPYLTHPFVLAETCPRLSCEGVSGTGCPMAQAAVTAGILLQPGSAGKQLKSLLQVIFLTACGSPFLELEG